MTPRAWFTKLFTLLENEEVVEEVEEALVEEEEERVSIHHCIHWGLGYLEEGLGGLNYSNGTAIITTLDRMECLSLFTVLLQ